MFPAIFLDRDGVLIENRSDYIRDWSQVQVFPEAINVLSLPEASNYKVVIVTNQSAVGRGLITMETAREINDRLVGLIHQQGGQVHGVYMCPHKPEDDCDCRKPRPGLFFQAAEELNLDLHHSWMIGDAWSDMQAGRAAGVQNVVLVKTGRGTEQLSQPRPATISNHLVFNDLSQAMQAIFSRDSSSTRDQPR